MASNHYPSSASVSISGSATRWTGAGLCALSAAGFASLTILGKFALTIDISLAAMLSVRFGGAGLLLALYLRFVRRQPIATDARLTVSLFLLGALGYAGQSALYFSALDRNPASLNALLLYVYPIFVALFGWLINRNTPTRREWGAMALASIGVIFSLGIGGVQDLAEIGPVDKLGVFFVLSSAVCYALYILSGEHVLRRTDPWTGTAWISIGAGASFFMAGWSTGNLDFTFSPEAAWLLPAMIVFSTILPLGTLLAGIERVGPTTASLMSTLEPIFTVIAAVLLLGERMTAIQFAGGVLVLAAVILLAMPTRQSRKLQSTGITEEK